MLGQDLIAAGDKELTTFRNLHIRLCFQFHNLLPDFTALENCPSFPLPSGLAARRQRRATVAATCWCVMGLEEPDQLPSANLSGGQKQRVAVARALMNGPELVLADEPTGNLDRASAARVMELIGQINREEGTTFLISTHDEKIAGLCRRQIVVGEGVVTG